MALFVVSILIARFMKKTKTSKDGATPALTKAEITRAAFNDSALSQTHFQLGDRTFPVKDLSYDQYTKFLLLVSPLVDLIIGRIGDKVKAEELGLGDLDISLFSVTDILRYCGDKLPEMAAICCQASDPTVTPELVKSLTNKPFDLAEIVLKQIIQNNMINDFAGFFARLLPMTKKK